MIICLNMYIRIYIYIFMSPSCPYLSTILRTPMQISSFSLEDVRLVHDKDKAMSSFLSLSNNNTVEMIDNDEFLHPYRS